MLFFNSLLLFLSAHSVSAVLYNDDGQPLPSTTTLSNNQVEFTEVMWSMAGNTPRPFNGTFLVNGFSNGGTCAASLIKTWSGEAPPKGLKAIALTSGRCLNSTSAKIGQGNPLLRYTLPKTDGAQKNEIKSMVFNSYRVASTYPQVLLRGTIDRVLFGLANVADYGIIQLNFTAQELYNMRYSFYKLSEEDSLPANTPIINVGFYDASAINYYMRKMTGKVLNAGPQTYEPTFGQSIKQAFSHNTNVFSTGGPVFKTDDFTTIHGIVTEGAPTKNYGMWVKDLVPCFKSDGTFSLNMPNCLLPLKMAYNQVNPVPLEGSKYILRDTTNDKAMPSNVAQAVYDQYGLAQASSEEDVTLSGETVEFVRESSAHRQTSYSFVFIALTAVVLVF